MKHMLLCIRQLVIFVFELTGCFQATPRTSLSPIKTNILGMIVQLTLLSFFLLWVFDSNKLPNKFLFSVLNVFITLGDFPLVVHLYEADNLSVVIKVLRKSKR